MLQFIEIIQRRKRGIPKSEIDDTPVSLSQCILFSYRERQNIDKRNFLLRPMEAIFLTETSCTCAARSSVPVPRPGGPIFSMYMPNKHG